MDTHRMDLSRKIRANHNITLVRMHVLMTVAVSTPDKHQAH